MERDLNVDQVKEILEKYKHKWRWAKTYEHFAPHEYLLRKDLLPEDKNFFEIMNEFIKKEGYEERFYSKIFKVINIGEFKYWLTGEKKEEFTLNRTKLGGYEKEKFINPINFIRSQEAKRKREQYERRYLKTPQKLLIRPAAIIIEDNKLVVVKTKKGNQQYYLLPGGGIEAGETIEEALKREVLEETSFIIELIRPVYINEYIHKEDKNKRVVNIFFIAKIIGKDEIKKVKDDDIIGIEYIPIDKLDQIEIYPEKLREFIKTDAKEGFNKLRYWVDFK